MKFLIFDLSSPASLIPIIVMRAKPMATPKLGYTAYQARTQWYMNQWGLPAFVRNALMEDGLTKLGIMAFAPNREGRSWWTIATNGMSERRMPCIERPHGDPSHRLELITYARDSADWICELLIEMARYPFEHRSGLAVGHTLHVTAKLRDFWSGYLIVSPKLEPSEFNPMAIDVGIGDDWIFFAEVMGLKADELLYAIDNDGPTFTEAFVTDEAEALLIDIDRASVLDGDTD
jgi:hypothetical protein